MEEKEKLVEEFSEIKSASSSMEDLQSELLMLQNEKNAYLKEDFAHSVAYKKMNDIIEECRNEQMSKKSLDNDDWTSIIAEVDRNRNNITIRLASIYPSLSVDDIHLCCLILLGLPAIHISYLLKISRSTYYNIEKSIVKDRMNITKNTPKLRDFLASF